MESISLILSVFLFGIFFLAAVGKLLDRVGSKKALQDFGLSRRTAVFFEPLLPIVEILVAFGLLFGVSVVYASVGAVVLLAMFTLGMAVQYFKGGAPNCHCFGQLHSEPVGVSSILRNLVLLAGAIVLMGIALQGFAPAVGQSFVVEFVFAIVLALVVLSIVIVMLLKQANDDQKEILKRLDVMDVIAATETSQERQEAGNPTDGLPIGAPVPHFLLPDVDHKMTSFEHLMNGKPKVFVFSSPDCRICSEMMPEYAEWKRELGDRIDLIIFSRGTSKENKDKFGTDVFDRIILQNDKEVAAKFMTKWSPTAVFISADGTIVSRPFVGDGQIRDMFDRIKTAEPERDYFHLPGGAETITQPRLGVSIPEFELKTTTGKTVTQETFKGRLTLAAFWSPDCPHCREMIDGLREWDNSKTAGDPQLIIFADADESDLKGLDMRSDVVIDKKYKTAIKIGMFGTPSAILVDENLKVASETAVSAVNIRALVGLDKDK